MDPDAVLLLDRDDGCQPLSEKQLHDVSRLESTDPEDRCDDSTPLGTIAAG